MSDPQDALDDDPCWSCGGDLAPFCHGEPPEIPGQADLLDELGGDA